MSMLECWLQAGFELSVGGSNLALRMLRRVQVRDVVCHHSAPLQPRQKTLQPVNECASKRVQTIKRL